MKKMTAFVGVMLMAGALALGGGCSKNKKTTAKPENTGTMKGGGEGTAPAGGGAYGGATGGGTYGGGGGMEGGNPCGG
jgi:hypothetical protein